jgi:hypothetical protein
VVSGSTERACDHTGAREGAVFHLAEERIDRHSVQLDLEKDDARDVAKIVATGKLVKRDEKREASKE